MHSTARRVLLLPGVVIACGLWLSVAPAAPPGKVAKADATAREPAVVAAEIDRLANQRLAADKVPVSPRADDAEFLRRVYLDLIGRIPTGEEAVAFLDSPEPHKRAKLIDDLLNRPEYGKHFATIWRNLIVNRDEMNKTLNSEPFLTWLADRFNENQCWDQIVREMLTAEGSTADNPAGIFFLAQRDMNRVAPEKIVGTAGNLFMGIQIQCAECHKHPFIKEWKQDDFWGMAAFFGHTRAVGDAGRPNNRSNVLNITEDGSVKDAGARKQLRDNKTLPAGATIAIPHPTEPNKFIKTVSAKHFLGDAPKLEAKPPYRNAFADWLTSPENPSFANAAVNRLWAHFFARGIVHPIDDFSPDNPPSHPELLKLMSREFVASGYDLKHLIRCICNTQAYQRTSRPTKGNEEDVLFSHMAVKVLSAESLYDSLTQVIGDDPTPNRRPPVKGVQRGPAQTPRQQFIEFFNTKEEGADATEFGHGVPQFLRLMNSAQLNRGGLIIDRLAKEKASPEQVVEGLYLSTLSRRPAPEELQKMTAYVNRQGDPKKGYSGVLWVLLNSAEFCCNHEWSCPPLPRFGGEGLGVRGWLDGSREEPPHPRPHTAAAEERGVRKQEKTQCSLPSCTRSLVVTC